MTDIIIFNGLTVRDHNMEYSTPISDIQNPMIGPYRVRTYLEQNNYNAEVIDWFDCWSDEEIIELISIRYENGLKVIGFGTTFLSVKSITGKLLSEIKCRWPDIKIICGGQEPYEDMLGEHPEKSKYLDVIFYGHSEVALLEYLKYLDNKPNNHKTLTYSSGVEYVIAPDVNPYTNATDLSTVWKKDDPVKYFNTSVIEISRGCMFKCKFCFSPLIGRKKNDYTRSPQNLADEIKRNYDLFGITHYVMADDTFNESNEKLEDIRKGIRLSGIDITFTAYMRYELLHKHKEQINTLLEMGAIGTTFGIESLNPQSRKAVGKGLTTDQIYDLLYRIKKTDRNFCVTSGFISGLPFENEEDTISTFTDFLKMNENNDYLDGWYWSPLFILDNLKYLSSAFSKEAHKYGYDIDPYVGTWKNAIHPIKTFDQAFSICNQLNDLIPDRLGSGFGVSDLISLGLNPLEASKIKTNFGQVMSTFDQKRFSIFNQYKQEKLNGLIL